MKNSLESACEQFFILLFRADSRLTGKTIVHFDEERKAKSNAIIVTAKQAGTNLAGPGGYDLELTVEYRSPVGTAKKVNDLVAAAIRETVYESTMSTVARANMARKAGLSALLIKDESTGDRQNSDNLRRRMITFPLQANNA